MARPIPDIDLRNISKEFKPTDESFFEDAIGKVPKNRSKDLILGTISGWLVGLGVAKVGKIAAFGLGGSVIILHYACEFGYIRVNWDRIRDTIGKSQQVIEKLQRFVKKQSCYSVGFVGGFFFGVASA
ncbi:unnamed protein product [Danaus chrysippus]|uniref:(African queen) hypothetical protein n=1 Tax=Danaus chrysippus TaxID=151541 RepID=A0A8J2VTT8_9NEOP|nr:unnamed protein product [Danaus chrysippus]